MTSPQLLNPGTQGAKRSRYFPNSPDALLRDIVLEHQRATESQLEQLFEDAVLEHGGEILSAIIAYWFANRYRALLRENVPISVRRERHARQEARVTEQVEHTKRVTVARIARTLLNKTLPGCGKSLRNMTKEDCCREGGWLINLAHKLEPGQTVSQAGFTDQQLWDLYNA